MPTAVVILIVLVVAVLLFVLAWWTSGRSKRVAGRTVHDGRNDWGGTGGQY